MEDTELEEGEACFYQYDGETNIDLDALTYIDEKLQNVLGHLKKDFEGGVTSENLGAKYGGYGSFLTQPSPAWSCSRSPANVQDNHSQKSVTCISAEGGNYSSLSRPSGNHSIKHESGSVRSASSDLYKAPSEHDSVRQIARTPFKHSTEESTAKLEAVDKSTSMNEQKTLKVRIKVGSDNLSAKKNAAIYSGLGLVSPSSSFGDSPIGSERLPQRFQFPGDESPTQIIRMMTSFPRSHLLSPLPEGLARLTEQLLQGHKVQPVFRHRRDNSVLRSNQKTDKTLSVEDSLKSEETDHLSSKYKEDPVKALDDVHAIMSDQADLNTAACEVLVSEALKLPLLSDMHGPSEGKRGTSKQKLNLLSSVVRGEPLISVISCDGNWNEKQIGDKNLAGKVADEKKVDPQTDFPSYPKQDVDSRGEAANSSSKSNENDLGPKSKKGSNSRPSSSQKQKNRKKHATVEQEGKKLLSGREQLPSGGKTKHKGSPLIGTEATEIQKENIRNVSGNKDFPKEEDIIKAKDKYKDLLGDMIEEGDDLMDSSDEPSDGRLNTAPICTQGLLPCVNNSRKRSDNGAHEQLISKVNSKNALDFAPHSGHVPPIGDPASAGAPDEYWVQCDKCLKWRLLPFGTKVDNLPEKWLCSMLNWLPGMNSCNITEEETTKAATEIYQPQNRNGLHGSLAVIVPGVTAASDLQLTQTRQDTFPGGGKKHHDLKEVPNSKQESLHSVKTTSLTNTVGSEMENELHFQHSREPTDPVLETNQRKKKSKKNKRDGYSDRGHSKDARLGGQQEPNQDYARAKRMRTKDEDWMSTHDVGNEMLIHNSSNELLSNGARKGLLINYASSSQSSKDHTDDSLHNSIKKSKFQVRALPHAGCLDTSNAHDGNADTKKRKVKSSIDVVNPSILSDIMVNESLQTRQKKARMPLLEEKASSSSKRNGKIENRRKSSRDHLVRKDVESTLTMDDGRSLKRELESGPNSGFSKVMDSQKSNSIVHELKSSPVELMSSCPFRITNSDKFASGKKNQAYKDCSHVDGTLTKDNSKRFADIEDNNSGGDKSGAMRKNLCGNNDHQSVHDLKDQIDGCLVDDKVQIKHSLDPSSHSLAFSQADTFDQHKFCTSGAPFDDGALNQPFRSVCNNLTNGSLSKQSAKVSSWSKDKNQILKPESDKTKLKVSESYDDSRDHLHTLKDKTKDIKIKFQEKSERNAGEMDYGGKKPSGIMLDNATKENGKLKSVGQEDSIVEAGSTCNHEAGSIAMKQVNTDCGEKISKRVDQVKNEEISGKEKSGKKGDLSNHVSLPHQGTGADSSCAHFQERGKGLKEHNSTKKPDIQYGSHSSTSKHQLSNAHRLKDRDTPSPMRRDSHNQAASNALKEAKDMKHLADRIKNSGSTESTGLYFEAALKFLHGACLLESSGSENIKRGDTIQSMQVYSSTAKLCEFCAHEFEKSKDLASASLAYKCMEVAYLRVIYSSHPAASRDRHELQNSLQMVPPGESPSSSASDIDNASNPAAAEKAAQAKDGNSPQPAGNHIIAAKSRPIFSRLMNFMQDVNFAMEASRKSQGAFAAAKATMKQTDSKEGISSIKRVLDYNFHDVNGLLRLVRLAMEAIKH